MKTRLRTHPFSKKHALAALLLFIGIQFATAQQVVQLYPEDGNLQAKIDNYAPGTHFFLNEGDYREQTIEAREGDTYEGELGPQGERLVTLKGSKVLTSSDFTQDNAGYWYIDIVVGDVAPTNGGCEEEGLGGTSDCCQDGYDCLRAEDIFVNGVPQKKVLSLAAMTEPGDFFIGSSRLYLRSNPNGNTIELSTARFAIHAKRINDVAASNVTVKNLIIEQYATPVQHGAIHAGYNSQFKTPRRMGKGWIIENNEVRYNHGAGIFVYTDGIARNNYVHHNGQIGMRSHGDNILIEENEITQNGNWSGVNWGWEGGGTKFTYSQDIQILNNYSHDNFGPGLWTDIDNYNSYYQGNRVENNQGPGIFHEISYSATIKCNTLINNWNSNGGGNFYGGNIFISNSSNVEVFDNVCISSGQLRGNGVIINCAYREKDGVIYYANNNHIHDNDIIFRADNNYTGALIQGNCTQANSNVFVNNRYHSVNTSRKHFLWGDSTNDTYDLGLIQSTTGQEQGSTIDGNTSNPVLEFAYTATSKSIALDWSGNIGDDFQVFWRVAPDGAWQSETVNTNAYTITDLEPDTEYKITIKNLCINRYANLQSITTLPCASFYQFNIGAVTSQSIALDWQQTNDDIQVLWRLESDITSWQSAAATTNSYTITGLNSETEYRITLKNLCSNTYTNPQNVITSAPSPTYYYITNRQTGDRFYPKNQDHNAPLLKANEGRSDDWVQWEKIPTSGNYFYLKNKATGKFIRPKDDNNGVAVWQVPTTYTGSYTQWEEIPVNNSSFYHLKNRATGKYFRPQTDTPDAPIQQQPNTWTGSWTQWTIQPVNAPKLQIDNLTFNLYPNPADDYIRIETQHISENSTVSIYDISGKLVMHQAVNTDIFDISVQSLTAGMYIARLDIGDGTYAAQRFVVK